MKYYIFYREDDDFNDILHDANIKKLLDVKLRYSQHLLMGGEEIPEDIQSYIVLKYGDIIKDKKDIFLDRKPKINIDYTPDPNRPERFKNL